MKTWIAFLTGLCVVSSLFAQEKAPVSDVQLVAYVGHGYSENVDVIDVHTMTILTTVTGAGGYRMVLSQDGSKLYSTGGDALFYITDTNADTLLAAFDPSTDNVFSSELEGIAISPDGSKVYAFDESADALFVIDTGGDSVIAAVYLDLYEAENAVFSPAGDFVYVNDNEDVVKISTDSLAIVSKAPVGNDGHGIGISADGNRLYADGAGIIVIDAASMTILDTLAGDGYYIQASGDGQRVYGVDESNELSVVDLPEDTLMVNVTLSLFSARGVTTDASGDTLLIATSQGLIKMDASTLTEIGSLGGSYQSVVIREIVTVGIGAEATPVAQLFTLNQNYPNPFNPSTTISYRLEKPLRVALKVYNLIGQQVAVLANGEQSAGHHTSVWNGRNDAGQSVSSGIYFYELTVGSEKVSRKMLFLK